MKTKIEDDMPEELTLSESEEYEWFGGFETYKEAKRIANKTGGTVYTQVDTDVKPDFVTYLKGWHIVNGTGWFIVLRKIRFE